MTTTAVAPSPRLLTAADLLQMPDDGNQYELVEGRLLCMGGTSTRPAAVAFNIGLEVGGFVKQHRLGLCGGADWGMLLTSKPDTVRVPDVAFVRADRIPPSGLPNGFWPGAPDLAVEVRSPSNRFPDILRKIADYLDAGTRLVWQIDPERRTAMAFREEGITAVAGADGVLDGEDVLPGFSLSLAQIWV